MATFQGFERVGQIGFVAIEKMFGVVDDALTVGFEMRNQIFDDP